MKAKNPITIGYRVGMITVEGKTTERKNGYMVWQCRCDCGKEIKLDTRCLQRRTVTDCGCTSVVRPGMLDLTGQRFGKLVCLRLYGGTDSQGSTQWLCQCDCGNTCVTSIHLLRAGYKKSCGCLSHPPIKDYVGKRFGQLTVIEYAGKRNGMHHWKCLCSCGKEIVVGQALLQTGKTTNCGCLSRPPINDYVGRRFDRLTVIGYAGRWRSDSGSDTAAVEKDKKLQPSGLRQG